MAKDNVVVSQILFTYSKCSCSFHDEEAGVSLRAAASDVFLAFWSPTKESSISCLKKRLGSMSGKRGRDGIRHL